MKSTIRLLCLIAALAAMPLQAQVQVPALMNYQGQLASATGTPLATGDYALTFSIYDAVQGGTRIWGPQIFDGTAGQGRGPKIPVVQGYFNVMLGPNDTTNRPLSDAFASGNLRYIEIKVGEAAAIAPRQQLLTAPFAFAASKASVADTAKVADNAQKIEGVDLLNAQGKLNTAIFASDAITASQLADNSVGSSELATNAVLSSKIATGAVTIEKLFDLTGIVKKVEEKGKGALIEKLFPELLDSAHKGDDQSEGGKRGEPREIGEEDQ
ncbi:MAG: hypothetical protein R3F19_17750 [Verrucomicrobiales bacterium]